MVNLISEAAQCAGGEDAGAASPHIADMLDVFLSVAGYSMKLRFGRQFVKLLAVVEQLLPALERIGCRLEARESLREFVNDVRDPRLPQTCPTPAWSVPVPQGLADFYGVDARNLPVS